MDAVFAFADSFQVKVLGLLYHGVIPPSQLHPTYFQNPLLSEICDSLVSLRTTYGDATAPMVENHLFQKKVFQDREYRDELLLLLPTLFELLPPSEIRYVCDQLSKFVRLERYRGRVRQAHELLYEPNGDTVDQLDALFAQPVSKNGWHTAEREFYFSSLPARLQRRMQRPDVLKTLIPELDTNLDEDGLGRQTFTLFAGLTSSGKSFALAHVALASVLQRKKTVYYTLEMSKDRIQARMDAQLSGVKTKELREHGDEVRAALTLRQRLFGDNLLVEKLPSGVTKASDIRADVMALQQSGFVPEVVIVDYMNRMRAETQSREGRHRDLGSVYLDLMGMGDELNLWVVSGAQAHRLGYQADLLTAAHLAESFEGAFHSDVIVTINRNDTEAAQEKARLYIAKDRTGVDKKIININTCYAKGTFYSRRARV